MGIKWFLNTQNCVKKQDVIVYYPIMCQSRKTYCVFPHKMGIKWFLNTKNCVKKQDVIVYYPKEWV